MRLNLHLVMKFALTLVPEKEVKLPEKKQDENPVNWKDDANLKGFINYSYTTQEQKEVAEEDIQLLKKNRLFTLTDWKKVTEEEKDKDGYPRGLRKILDEAGEGILNFS